MTNNFPARGGARDNGRSVRGGGATAMCAVLLALDALLFALQLHINDLAVRSQIEPVTKFEFAPGGGPFGLSDVLGLPYPVIHMLMHPAESLHVGIIVLAFVQAAVLFGLFRVLQTTVDRPVVRAFLGVTIVVMFAEALRAASLTSLDMYAYVGYAKLGFAHAFAPNAAPFPGEFAIINRVWGRPMEACDYGPLWLAIEQFVISPTTTLAGAILATRVLGAASLAACVILLLRCRLPRAAVVLVAVNPALLGLFVANGHNDLLAVDFALGALSLAAAAPIAASVLMACAGLSKIPLTALSLVIFAGNAPLVRRVALVILTVALVLVASDLSAGPLYLRDLFSYAGGISSHHLDAAVVLGRALAVLGIVALLVAFFRGIIFPAGAWPIFMLGGVILNWYLSWGIPYAARARAAFVQVVIAFPVVAVFLEHDYGSPHPRQYAMAVLIAYVVYDFVRYRTRAIPIAQTEPATAQALLRPVTEPR